MRYIIALLIVLFSATAYGQNIGSVRGTDGTQHYLEFDPVTGWPKVECSSPAAGSDANVHDGANNPIDSRTGALSVVQEDGSGNLVSAATEATVGTLGTEATLSTLALEATLLGVCTEATAATLATEATAATLATQATLATIDTDTGVIAGDTTSLDSKTPVMGAAAVGASMPVNIARGILVDSLDAGQDASWLEPTAPGGADGDKGTITVADFVAGGPAVPILGKVYEVPTTKEFHDISITGIAADAANYQFTYMVLGMDVLPGAFALADYMSVGYLLVPSFTVARNYATITVAHSLIRSRAKYFIVIVPTTTVAPAQGKLVRIKSYNASDEVL